MLNIGMLNIPYGAKVIYGRWQSFEADADISAGFPLLPLLLCLLRSLVFLALQPGDTLCHLAHKLKLAHVVEGVGMLGQHHGEGSLHDGGGVSQEKAGSEWCSQFLECVH